MSFFDYIQTFYVVPDAVGGANEVMATSLELYFKSKPSLVKNISGSKNPGITVWLCDVENNSPIPERVVKKSITNVEYDFVNTSQNSQSGTIVRFSSGVLLKAGKFYGIVIKYDDPAFEIWLNKQGDKLVNDTGVTNVVSSGSQGRFDGILYKSTNTNDYLSFSDRDLKFKVNIAKYIETSGTFYLVNKPYEFLKVGSSTGSFVGGEFVYANTADETGTISISSSNLHVTGTGTDFSGYTAGNFLVAGGDVLKIKTVANATSLILDELPATTNAAATFKYPPVAAVSYTDYTQNKVYLTDSNAANATFRFAPGTRIIGERSGASANVVSLDRYQVDNFTPKFLINNPSTSKFDISYTIANTGNAVPVTFSNIELLKSNDTIRESYLLSRSQEVVEGAMYGTSKRSSAVKVDFTVNVSNTNLFSVPYIETDELDFYTYQNDINSTSLATKYGITDYDTEVEKNGTAKSKYISTKVSFAVDKYAEDIRVFLTAYKPAGTNIKVYAKLHNSIDKETFDDKAWSPLELKDNIDKFSGESKDDLIEYTYGLPSAPETQFNLTGQFIVSSGSDVVVATVDPTSSVYPGDLIKIYDPIRAENYEVFSVISVASGSITVNKPIINNNILGNMYVDRLKYKNVAWNNIANDNVSRYVNVAGVEFDTFNTMQIKVVFLADDAFNVPEVHQIQAIGVSA